MRRWAAHAALVALLVLAADRAVATELVRFEQPLRDAKDLECVRMADELLERTAAAVGKLYGDWLAPTSGQAAWAVATVASREQGTLSLVLTLRRLADGAAAPPVVWMAAPADSLPLYLARGLFARWNQLRGLPAPSGPPPVLVDRLDLGDLRQYLTPLALATLPGGRLAVSASVTCLVLDEAFRVVGEPASELSARNMTYAAFVSATPGGTLILRPASGRELYRVTPGGAVERIALPGEATQYQHAALSDGSALLVEYGRQRALVAWPGGRREIALHTGPRDFFYAFASAPDGTIWVWDYVLRGLRIHAADGQLVDYLVPILEDTGSLVPTAMAVGPEGDVILAGDQALARVHRDGTLAWRLTALPGGGDLPRGPSLAVDWERGLIYLGDPTAHSVTKLLDRSLGPGDAFAAKLVALGDDLADRARAYEEAGSPLVARAAWQRVLDDDPANAEAKRRFDALEVALLRQAADALAARAIDTLRSIGIENARPIYQQAIAKYELVLARAPGDKAASAAKADLERLFADPGRLAPSIQILEAKLDDLFPSMMSRYAVKPVGTATVKNVGAAALEGVVASVTLPGFTDVPAESKPVASLAPGATATIELRVALSQSVLENDEDMRLQARLEVTAASGPGAAKAVATVLHRRTALTWEETGRIAAFITPNEQVVSDFAARLSDTGDEGKRWHLSPRLTRAMRIVEGLAVHGVAYVEDPATPITKTLEAPAAIDTVRFARDTLSRHAGDCDDTTVLLASLLEAAGIPTAILTTPGHIFLAFDSGEPAECAGLLATGGLEVIASGAAWIPVETTVLKDGFMAAWKAASTLVRQNRETGLEFLPVRELRSSWPALALPKSTVAVVEPAASAVDARFTASVAGFEQRVYTARLAELDTAAGGLSGRKARSVRVQQGILHALFGRLDLAEAAFSAVIREDPSFASPYADLANVKVLAGDVDAAMTVLQQGLAKAPSSVVLALAMARYESLAQGGARAASESEPPVLPWWSGE